MTGDPRTRERIINVATQLLIEHGFGGFRFLDVADRLDITRPNVHYHFGSKEKLTEEVVVRYVNVTLKKFKLICEDTKSNFTTKIKMLSDSNRERYIAYNPTMKTGRAWSLIARMRLERDVIGPEARHAIEKFSRELERYARRAFEIAIEHGELRPDAPINDLVLMLVAIANSADPITRDASSFDRLAELYGGFGRIVSHAYGVTPPTSAS